MIQLHLILCSIIFIFIFYSKPAFCFKCGLSPVTSSRIVGGDEAQAHQFPWMAYLENQFIPIEIPNNNSFTYYTSFCGGALIDNQWVVTAAHCFPAKSPYDGYRLNETVLMLGAFNFSDSAETRKVMRTKNIFIHESYDGKTNVHDIALVKLNHKLNIANNANHIAPICLPFDGEMVSTTECQIAGWGRVGTSGKGSAILKYADVDIMDPESCRKYWPKHTFRLELCAGGKDDRTCRGDSGGPLQCRNDKGQWVLQGVTSFSDSICESEYPSVFTKIVQYILWINKIRAAESGSGTK